MSDRDYLEDWQNAALERIACSRGAPVTDIVRAAISWYLCTAGTPEEQERARDAIMGSEDDPIVQMAGSGSSGQSDGSINYKHHLYGAPERNLDGSLKNP